MVVVVVEVVATELAEAHLALKSRVDVVPPSGHAHCEARTRASSLRGDGTHVVAVIMPASMRCICMSGRSCTPSAVLYLPHNRAQPLIARTIWPRPFDELRVAQNEAAPKPSVVDPKLSE